MKKVDLIIYSDNLLTCKGDDSPKTGDAMSDVGRMINAGIAVIDGKIEYVGERGFVGKNYYTENDEDTIDTGRSVVTPGLIDSHTHPVFAGNRVNEFIMRAQGATYQEIHAAGGGIQSTVDNTRAASDEQLYKDGEKRLLRMLNHGTTTVEAKSGYGLNTEEEIRGLEVIKRLNDTLPLNVVATFLGAHSLPREYKDRREEFVRLVIDEMMPLVKERNLARFVDVFCEEGAFTLEETREILEAAKEMGFGLKLHSEEFTNMGSAAMAGKMGAVSVDHLLMLTDEDVRTLSATDTVLTLMPGTLFFLDYNEFAPARRIIDNGCKMSLATDFNAGSCISASMQMAMSLGCVKMKMTPEEALNAATYNAAFAVGMQNDIGSVETGKIADLAVFDVEDYRLIPYQFGENIVKMVIKSGKAVIDRTLTPIPGKQMA